MNDEPVSLHDSLRDVVRSLRPETPSARHGDGHRRGVDAAAMGGVFGKWDDAVGPAVAAHVQPVKLEGTTLVVEVDDPAWATQLRFLELTVRNRLQEVAGVTVDRLEVRVARRR